ncbi:MAG TPA: arsenosugar biosynthesis radical SAM (seleno)protein ArsS [Verrucomicrobiae bacterium]|nr:arsenosugar biosynthesis radical SAM (seleno)protein ArsS [Verrucomicrobiae bacterium]
MLSFKPVQSYHVPAMNRFDQKLAEHGLELRRSKLRILQLNVGRKCNQACRHCHVDAAPWRTEMIDRATAERIVDWIGKHRPEIVDITGGAPELSEYFRFLVEASRAAGAQVIDRNNLTILEEAGYENLPEFLARHEVEIIASLPCYLPENVNKQRGNGVYDKSIRGLHKLNAVGYGGRFPLHLVYNPLGPALPPPQAELEADYKEALQRDHGIVFNRLYTLTNQPIARFAEDLRKQNKWDDYLELLANSFNPHTIEGLMCRDTLSVDYRGRLYDCDFNQMLEMALTPLAHAHGSEVYLWDITPEWLDNREIQTGVHCLACTAGSGSSCTGALN